VVPCSGGEDFCGTVCSVGRDGKVCSVVLGGLVRLPFSGTAPGLGWTALAADGQGGVTAGSGREYLVVDVDEAGKTAVCRL